jgi:CSLREA domain-containing protein
VLALFAILLALPVLGRDAGPRLLAASIAAGQQLAASAGPAAHATRTLPAGLREAASAAVGSSDTGFHVRRAGGALVAHGGGLTVRFGRTGVGITAAGGRLSMAPVGLGAAVTPVATGNRVSYRRAGVTEWYVNGPAGLEQGFTLARPQSLSLRVSGTLVPHQRGQAIEFTRGTHGAVVLRYSGLTAFDAGGHSLPARLELTGRTLALRMDDRGARYPVTIDPLIQQGAKLKAGGATAQFGWSVALSDAGDVAVVGAPFDSNNTGAAWVFTRSGSIWTQAAQLTPTAGEQLSPGFYGFSVAISGDGNTALVGSPQDGGGVGAVWVFRQASPTSWPEQQELPTPTDETAPGDFGYSVSLSTDGDTALIGAPADNTNLGAAWVYGFSPFAGGWTQQTSKLTGGGEIAAGKFGYSVALSGDGVAAVIGAPDDDPNDSGGSAGTAWVFLGTDGWFEIATLHPAQGEEDDTGEFGSSVAIADDGNTVLVGARNQAAGAGAAWIFTPSANGWFPSGVEVAHLLPGDEDNSVGGGQFGASVALAGDGGTALIGGYGDAGVGAAWLFKPVGPNWVQAGAKLKPNDGAGPAFGWATALSQDGSSAFFGGPTDNGAAGAAWPFAQGAQTYTVTTTADTVDDALCQASSCTLRQAVNAANFGVGTDTIVVPAGSYQLSGNFGALALRNGMTITGAGARSTSILAAAPDRVLDLTASANPVVIQGFTISGGTATPNNGFFGGNIRSSGVLTLLEDTITNGNAYSGGGVSNNAGTLLVDRSTISGNTALNGGGDSGGIQNFGDNAGHPGTLTIRNSTITSNTARAGGGVLSWNDNGNTTTVENSTISSNAATDRGLGGIGGSGTFTFKNTIVSNNTFGGAPSNCDHTMTSLGNNLESGTDCGFTAAGDIQNKDPLLGALADNGGPTDTLAITSASPAFDAGSADCPPPATDQRGTARAQGAKCDIGAFELAVAAPSPPAPSGPAAPAAAAPTIVGQAAPTIGAESATVSASVNPNGSATSVVVQYGTTTAYGQQTAAVGIGAGTTLQIVNQTLSGLTPSTVYHFRFVATNAAGTSNGPDATFTTAVPGGSSQQPPPGPVQGVSANVFPLVGTVLVNGQPLVVGQQIPLGSTVDARNGTVLIRVVVNGVVQEMQFSGGIFQLLQLPNGTVQLVLTGGDFSICKATKSKKNGVRVTGSASRADNARTVRMLWGNGKGSFQTKGRYAAATVRGTIYQVADRCDGTFTRVRQGTVSVQDLVLNKTVSVPAGRSYLAKAKP